MSPDPTNQTTAKGTLTQMLSITFARFEQSGVRVSTHEYFSINKTFFKSADDTDLDGSRDGETGASKGKGEKRDSIDVKHRSEAKVDVAHNGLPNGKTIDRVATPDAKPPAAPATPTPTPPPPPPASPAPAAERALTPDELARELVLSLIDRALPVCLS